MCHQNQHKHLITNKRTWKKSAAVVELNIWAINSAGEYPLDVRKATGSNPVLPTKRVNMMAMWNPWRGCKKCSDGCLHCYIHKGDAKRGINTNEIVQTKDFVKPIEKLKNGEYKMKSGMVYLCFSTDFLIEEADAWRQECWQIMKARPDCTFLFLTKRIERLRQCLPADWC